MALTVLRGIARRRRPCAPTLHSPAPPPHAIAALEIAAAAMLQGMTAHYLTHSTFALKPGHACLVHAAAGGVGLLLVQMAKQLGAYVIATASNDEKRQLARDSGALEVLAA